MQLTVLFITAVATVSQASPQIFLKSEWLKFKTEHVKTYSSDIEEQLRMNIFIENHNMIAEHNSKFEEGLVTYKLGINQFADMLPEEFENDYLGVKFTPEMLRTLSNHSVARFIAPTNLEVPESIDWREQGAVTPVKDQKKCGSCWAFSTTGSVEGLHFIKTGKLVSLSEQQLVDCSRSYGNQGCDHGSMDSSFRYIRDHEGIDTEESYPYEAKNDKCRFKSANVGAKVTGFVNIDQGDEDDLKAAVAAVGPVSVAVFVNENFRFYKSGAEISFNTHDFSSTGVFYDPNCIPIFLNHAVLAVGYGTDENGKDYWLVKNSWNETWGDGGYIKMARNKLNHCGIATAASYPTL
ncbi:hypothetical protein QAD02_016287 [Eretmocerus hayati]|uniref:Uncharacterized protein n=1 Tax=Eretmocerus hayati TaxID=131215 RepID=A0ACC2PA65_9HYME|nr:hypothetical protein QAD02_016287 [Eretmocerus hayati]